MDLALIQLMAAAEAKRDVCYFTFRDSQFVDELCDIHDFVCDLQLTVGENLMFTYSHTVTHNYGRRLTFTVGHSKIKRGVH